MKATKQQFIELLAAAGVPDVEVVENETDSDFKLDSALQAIDGNRSGILKPKIESELRETVEKEVSGLQGGKLIQWLTKHTGVARAALNDKSDEEKVKAAIAHMSGQLDGDKQSIQAKIDELLGKHTQEIDGLKSEYETKLSAANERYMDREITDYIAAELKDFPFKSDVDKAIAIKDLKADLKSRYDLTIDETAKAVNLFSKDKPGMPALNAAGTAKVSIKDEATAYFKPRGQVATDMRDAARQALNKTNEQGGTYTPSGPQQGKGKDFTTRVNELAASQGIPVAQ